MTMRSLPVSKFKATLSEQLRRVRKGDVIVVTDRGKPVAKVVPAEVRSEELAALDELERAGLVRIGTGELSARFGKLRRPSDATGAVRRAVLEERETGQ
jgi:prevent-host-death family protein